MYYVAETGDPTILAIVNMENGARVSTITLRDGVLDSTPIITQDRCSLVVKKGEGSGAIRRGLIYRIPQGNYLTDFRIS